MITQPYYCSACGAGSVNHACNAGVSEVCTIIKADHRQRSPECQGKLSARISERKIIQEKPMSEPKRQLIWRDLQHEFDTEELLELGKAMGNAQNRVREKEAQLKSVTTQIKAEIASAQEELTGCAEKLRAGYEMRRTECELWKNRTEKTIDVIRLDTYKVIERRKMTIEEQQELPLEEEGGNGNGGDPVPILAADAVIQEDI